MGEKQWCTVLFSREGMCGQKLRVEKPAETGDKYPKSYTQNYEKRERMSMRKRAGPVNNSS